MSDNTPTQRFEVPAGTGGSPLAQRASPHQKKTPRGLIIALIVVGAVLLIALTVLLIVLFIGGGRPIAGPTTTATATASDTPSPTPTASTSPSPTPSASTTTAPPPPSGPSLISFTTDNSTVACSNKTGNPIPLSFRWAGTNGSVVYIAVGATSDPKQNGQGWTLPTVGTQADFPYELDYGCYNAKVTYSLGIYDSGGHKSVKQITITNTGDQNG